MQIHLGTGVLRAEWERAVICIGTFDGVHLGHEAVIRTAVEDARNQDLPVVLVTFDRHPAAILAPAKNPQILAPLEDNLARFEQLEVSVAVVLPFDAELSRMSADRFLSEVLRSALRASEIVVGHDFAMGNGREGTTDWLAARIKTTVVPAFTLNGERVSSSRIRRAIEEGDLFLASRLLGRPYVVGGLVVGGQKLGRQLGYPTVNLARSTDQLVPPHGIYASRVSCRQGRFLAATSIGTRPTVGGVHRTIEAYLLDYPGQSLYGEPIRIEFLDFLREERNFSDVAALVDQMAKDVRAVRDLAARGITLA